MDAKRKCYREIIKFYIPKYCKHWGIKRFSDGFEYKIDYENAEHFKYIRYLTRLVIKSETSNLVISDLKRNALSLINNIPNCI